jgi:hypothetical protein
MVCVCKNRLTKGLEAWAETIGKFKRLASSPANKFILEDDDVRLQQIQTDMASRTADSQRALVNWSKYKSRHQNYRLTGYLGYRRPLTRYQDSGSCKMPDFYWHEWSRVQPERIWDTLDMNFLRSLDKHKFDLNFKQYVFFSLPFLFAFY